MNNLGLLPMIHEGDMGVIRMPPHWKPSFKVYLRYIIMLRVWIPSEILPAVKRRSSEEVKSFELVDYSSIYTHKYEI